jgi:hypothetical protein
VLRLIALAASYGVNLVGERDVCAVYLVGVDAHDRAWRKSATHSLPALVCLIDLPYLSCILLISFV